MVQACSGYGMLAQEQGLSTVEQSFISDLISKA